MKIKQIAAAVSAVLLSSSVFALPPSTIPDVELFISGASAQDKSIKALVTSLCVPDPTTGASTLDTFQDASAKPGKAYTSYFCKMDNTTVPGLITNPNVPTKNVLVHKRSKGGSAQGVSPIIAGAKGLSGAAIASLDIYNTANVSTGNCTNTAGTRKWLCTIDQPGDLITRIPNMGVSDVNPKLFTGANTPANFSPVAPTDVDAYLTVKPAAALVFGVPVTTSLRDALQEAQLASGKIPATWKKVVKDQNGNPTAVSGTCAVGVEEQDCMPSLTKRQVASLISGQIRDWSAFKVVVADPTTGAKTSTPLTTLASNVPVNTSVHYCRRVPGSGTQAQQGVKFLNYPCTANAPAPSLNSARGGIVVVQNQGSGDESICLDDLNYGTNNTGYANPNLAKVWALGTQSTEKNNLLASLQSHPDGISDNYKYGYRFVKIDGAAPTLVNAANGSYNDWVEQTFQWAKAGANTPSTDQSLIIGQIANNAGDPTTIGTNNGKYVYDWGQAGYLAVSTKFAPAADGILDQTGPVIPYTHSVGGVLDNCIVPVVNTTYQASEL